MFSLKNAIRILFSSLMLLPLIILVNFMVHFTQDPDYISLALKRKSITVKDITWPDNGLLTIWFDSPFFSKNKKIIVELMNKYQFPGVISLSKYKSDRTRSLPIYQLFRLQNQGWEIAETSALRGVKGEHEINDMPAPSSNSLAVYDMSNIESDAALIPFLKKTTIRNGWIILYFHTRNGPQEKPMSRAQLNRILQIVRHSGMPVVLREQVWRVSQ